MEEYVAKSVLKKELNIANLHSGIVSALQNIVDEIPVADVREVKHGEWKQNKGDSAQRFYCTICFEYGNSNYQYCPWCGAKMDEERNERKDVGKTNNGIH